MSDPPDKLNAKATAFGPQDTGAASVPPNVRAPKIAELKASLTASLQRAAELEALLLQKEKKIEDLEQSPPTIASWLNAKMESKFRYIEDLIVEYQDLVATAATTQTQVGDERRQMELEREEFDALMTLVDDATHLNGVSFSTPVEDLSFTAREAMEAETKRTIALLLKQEDVVQQAAKTLYLKDKGVENVLAQHRETVKDTALQIREEVVAKREKVQEIWHAMVQDFDLLIEEERRKELSKLDKAAPPESRRFALSDPEIKDLLEDRELKGYLTCARQVDLRVAYRSKLESFDMKQIEYLKDIDHPNNPYQKGVQVGERYGWRALCHFFDKPDWDLSLDPHKWVWQEFWTVNPDTVPGSFWGGVEDGFSKAEKKFKAREAKEAEQASFTTVAPKKSNKSEASKHAGPKRAKVNTQSEGNGKHPGKPEKAHHGKKDQQTAGPSFNGSVEENTEQTVDTPSQQVSQPPCVAEDSSDSLKSIEGFDDDEDGGIALAVGGATFSGDTEYM